MFSPELKIMKPGGAKFIDKVKNCVYNGDLLLLEDINEDIDPGLNSGDGPLLLRTTIKNTKMKKSQNANRFNSKSRNRTRCVKAEASHKALKAEQ